MAACGSCMFLLSSWTIILDTNVSRIVFSGTLEFGSKFRWQSKIFHSHLQTIWSFTRKELISASSVCAAPAGLPEKAFNHGAVMKWEVCFWLMNLTSAYAWALRVAVFRCESRFYLLHFVVFSTPVFGFVCVFQAQISMRIRCCLRTVSLVLKCFIACG